MSVLDLGGSAGEAGKQLSRAFEENRLPHALILEGPAEARNRAAGLLAQALVCGSEGTRPCGRCPGCVKARAGSHPDITRLDGDEDPRAFPVDAIRKIRSDAFVRPNEAPCRVFMLLGAQNMTEVSQNALLKVLEEPPENVFFLLTASGGSALLPTVRSRAQVFSLEGEPAPAAAEMETAEKLARAVVAKNESELLFAAAGLITDKARLRAALERLLLVFRDAAVLRAGGSACLSGLEDTARLLAGAMTRDRLLALWEEAGRARAAVDRNANAALLVTTLCANLREAAGR